MTDLLAKHYKMIEVFYQDKNANRSGVPYMNHIIEGLKILESIEACEFTKAAYCIHPILQLPDSLRNTYDNPYEIDSKVLLLSMEYRNKANAYLCRPRTDDFTLEDMPYMVLPEVANMLIADKVQNYSDFVKYHKGIHKRSAELDRYFNLWFEHLKIDYKELSKIIH